MKRKNFLQGALGMAAATALLGKGEVMAQQAPKSECEKKLAGKSKFMVAWIAACLGNMKKELTEPEMTKVIEENGRACAERGAIAWVESFHGDIDKFLAEMGKEIGATNARREGNKITLVYEKCFCPLVGDSPGTLPPEYCLCTRGWTKAVYGALAGKEVKVDLKSSIKRGDPQCLIEVDLG